MDSVELEKRNLYDSFFGIMKDNGEVFDVQIIKSSKDTYWYSKFIGQKFSVIDNGKNDLVTVVRYPGGRYFADGGYINNYGYIQKTDAIIL